MNGTFPIFNRVGTYPSIYEAKGTLDIRELS
jgi:hypothetical protein